MLLYDACSNLELRPKPEDVQHLRSLLWEIDQEDNTSEEIEEYIRDILKAGHRYFEPYCRKSDSPCVILESGVISLRASAVYACP